MKPSPLTEHDHVDGPSDAALTLIEYADYECPYCVKAFPILEKVRAAFAGKLRFVYRHVPRSASRGFAGQAAEAAEFAASQGQFWAMNRQIYAHPDQHALEQLVEHARVIGLDPEACRAALVERRFAERVRESAVASVKSGIIGTPTLFINDQRYEDRLEEELLLRALGSAA